MSILISDSFESKSSCDRIFVSCVFPTPVGPRKINDPMGFPGSFKPTRFLLIAFTTFSTASFWPIIFSILEDVLRTFIEHIAQQISTIIHPFNNVLFTGGGVYNDFLIKRIQIHSNTQIIIPPNDIINYKEALIFSLLGVLKIDDKINCLSSVTGAKINHSSGKIFNQNISD